MGRQRKKYAGGYGSAKGAPKGAAQSGGKRPSTLARAMA
jgi:hypothetical protein